MKKAFNWAKARRIMSKFLCSVMIATAIVSFSSCSDDDDEDNNSPTTVSINNDHDNSLRYIKIGCYKDSEQIDVINLGTMERRETRTVTIPEDCNKVIIRFWTYVPMETEVISDVISIRKGQDNLFYATALMM
ncbi:MAG: hypothetical protein LBR17_07815 [Bacteroidales bacterium]|jgi:hypothetical protein|nr:hypothetical protein [Bacteroidales bacterium]